MYLLASARIRVHCRAEETYDYATNLENFAAWFPGVLEVTAGNDLPQDAVGKIYQETVAIPFGGRRHVEIRVVEADWPGHFVTEGRLPGLWPRMEIDIKTTLPEYCEIHWQMYSRNRSALVRWTLLPLARRLMRRRAVVGLQKLKQRLEIRAE